MNTDLQSSRVLFRAPDSCQLFGIPYEMRRDVNQEPRHLWEASKRRYDDMSKGNYTRGAGPMGPYVPPNPIGDWMVIDEFDPDTKAWLAALDDVPTGPCEWCECKLASDDELNTVRRHDKLALIEHSPGHIVRVLYGYRGNNWFAPDGTEGLYWVKRRMGSSNDYKLVRMGRVHDLTTLNNPDGIAFRREIAETCDWDLIANSSRLVRHFTPEAK